MSTKCFWPECQDYPLILAKCNQENLYFCSYHSQNHLEQCSNSHNCESILKNISFNKVELITKLNEVIKWTKDVTDKSIKDCDHIIYEINIAFKKIICSIKKIQKYCKNMIEKVERCGKVPIFFNNKINSSPTISFENIKDEFTTLYENEFSQCKKFCFESSELQKEIEKSFNLLFYSETIEWQNRYLDTFITNSKTLVNFDIDSCTYIKKDIDLPDDQIGYFSICRLSLDEIFIYGGFSNKCLDSCFIITIKNSNVIVLPKGIKRSTAQSLLFNNIVYIFGGKRKSSTSIKDCHKFDLTSKSWKTLSPLCTELSCTSPILWKTNEILVVGSDNSGKRYLLSYKTKEDIYLRYDFNYNYESYLMNILVSSEKLIILLCGGTIFVTNIGTSFSWKKIDCNNHFDYCGLKSQISVRNNKAYFIDVNNHVFSLCLETFKIVKLLQIV